MKTHQVIMNDNDVGATEQLKVLWHPSSPDLTNCRSLWLNNLEVRVNQRDSSLISIANDLSQVNYKCIFSKLL